MAVLFPTDPQDRYRTKIEQEEWQKDNEQREKEKRRENRRYWLSIILSAVAALSGILAVILQLVSMQ